MPNPHQQQPRLHAGAPLDQADSVVILIHGRGDSARGILGLAGAFETDGVAYMAPQAANSTWYPQRFLAPLMMNEPWLSSALTAVGDSIEAAHDAGFDDEHIVLGGFSQGACLALEYAARHAHRFGGVFAFSGGLIGPDIERGRYRGSFDGTPVFLGCSDIDFHIPVERVHASTELMRDLGAEAQERIYPGMGHTVNADEVAHVQVILDRVLGRP
jgi:predicted esterase